MTTTNVIVEKIHEDAVLPKYAHGPKEDAGADLYSVEDVVLSTGQTIAVSTGLKFALPPGVQAEIRSRSGLSIQGIVVANSPGTVDTSYRGEIKVILHYQPKQPPFDTCSMYRIKKGDKIAQVVFMPYLGADFKEAVVGSDTQRGEGGFGSTGLK